VNNHQSHTTIVTPQLPLVYRNGSIASFASHFIKLLQTATDDKLTIIFTEPSQVNEALWKPQYEKQGIEVISIHEEASRLFRVLPPEVTVSETACRAIPRTSDTVYFADWRANGLQLVRSRRFKAERSPTVVTVLHGNTAWHRQGQQFWPSSYEEMRMDFSEQYAVRHSDFAVAPSKYIVGWMRASHYPLPVDAHVRVLNYPFFRIWR